VSGAANGSSYQFTGRENDGTGLYFYRARYHSPTFQRFIAQDPIGFRGGDWNLYGFVSNDPANQTDPQGLGFVSCIEKIVQLVFAINNLMNRIDQYNAAAVSGCNDKGHEKAIDQANDRVNNAGGQAINACAGTALIAAVEEMIREAIVQAESIPPPP